MLSVLSLLAPWQFPGILLAAGIGLAAVFGVGFYEGDSHRAAMEASAKAAWITKQTAAADAARKADAEASAKTQAKLQAQLDAAGKAEGAASTAPCFDATGAANLRSLWGAKNGKHH